MQYNPFSTNDKKRKLTPRDKYREATRATEALRSELADIADDDEFFTYLNFVLEQWRRVRQRRLEPDQGSDEATLSQAHSLYSEELGSVNIVKPAPVPLAGDLFAHSQEVPSQEGHSDIEAESVADQQANPQPRVALNPRAAKSGRPRLDISEQQVKDRENRLRFNAAQEVWQKKGSRSLTGLLQKVVEDQPGMLETASRLDSLRVRLEDKASSRQKPKFSVEKVLVLNNTAFYLLPDPVLDKCFDVLPLANAKDDAITLFSQSQSQSQGDASTTGQQLDSTGKPGVSKGVECVSVLHYGKFSRTQIEAIYQLSKLKSDCEEGKLLCRWLSKDVSDFRFDGRPSKIASEVESKFPYGMITGFAQDYAYEELYRIRPGRWISDALISAFCERITKDFNQVRYLEALRRKRKGSHRRKDPLPTSTKTKITAAAMDESVDVMILPVNFENEHWTVVIVFKSRGEILLYDSIGSPMITNALADVAQDIGTILFGSLGKSFSNKTINSPLQSDRFSCGIFVCHKIARLLDHTVSNDMSDTGLTNVRFRLLVYVLHGVKV